MHYIKVNQHAAAIHISRGVDEETGRIDYPLCGVGSENLLGRKTVPFRPVKVDDDPTCKRCIKIADSQYGMSWRVGTVAAPEPEPTPQTIGAPSSDAELNLFEYERLQTGREYLRALRNFRDFGTYAAKWVDNDTTNALENAGHIKAASGRAGFYVTKSGLDQIK